MLLESASLKLLRLLVVLGLPTLGMIYGLLSYIAYEGAYALQSKDNPTVTELGDASTLQGILKVEWTEYGLRQLGSFVTLGWLMNKGEEAEKKSAMREKREAMKKKAGEKDADKKDWSDDKKEKERKDDEVWSEDNGDTEESNKNEPILWKPQVLDVSVDEPTQFYSISL